jgi:uncharacterized membrane protein
MKNRWQTGRIEAFSDGVLAIAITLLVLELSVPEESFNDLWAGILEQWPSYLAYVTSFLTIGVIWFIHHGMFRRLAFADAMVTRLNLILLMLVALLPYPTKLMAEAINNSESERAAVIFYGFVLLSISALLSVIWRHGLQPGLDRRRCIPRGGPADQPAEHTEHGLLRGDPAGGDHRAAGRRLRLSGDRDIRTVPQPGRLRARPQVNVDIARRPGVLLRQAAWNGRRLLKPHT